ncbi:hypothetical protein ACRFDU_25640, partial [Klebsiella pneumoniae]
IGPDPRNFNQRVSLGRNDLLIRTFLNCHEVTKYIRDGIVVFANYPVEYWLCYSLLYFVVCSTFT